MRRGQPKPVDGTVEGERVVGGGTLVDREEIHVEEESWTVRVTWDCSRDAVTVDVESVVVVAAVMEVDVFVHDNRPSTPTFSVFIDSIGFLLWLAALLRLLVLLLLWVLLGDDVWWDCAGVVSSWGVMGEVDEEDGDDEDEGMMSGEIEWGVDILARSRIEGTS